MTYAAPSQQLPDIIETVTADVNLISLASGIPEVQVPERIQEPIVEPIKVLPQERVQQHTALQIVHVPVPQIQEQPAVPDLVTCVEASQVVGSLLPLREFVAPMCNQVLQEQIVATVQPHDRFQEIPEVQVLERIQVSPTTLIRDSRRYIRNEYSSVANVRRLSWREKCGGCARVGLAGFRVRLRAWLGFRILSLLSACFRESLA